MLSTNRYLAILMTALLLLPAAARSDYDAGRKAANAKNFKKALAEWTPLAESGHRDANFGLGRMYARGDGVKRDFGKARAYFERAAELGHPVAAYNVGQMYQFGDGMTINMDQAVAWYKRSALLGNADAKKTLKDKFGISQFGDATVAEVPENAVVPENSAVAMNTETVVEPQLPSEETQPEEAQVAPEQEQQPSEEQVAVDSTETSTTTEESAVEPSEFPPSDQEMAINPDENAPPQGNFIMRAALALSVANSVLKGDSPPSEHSESVKEQVNSESPSEPVKQIETSTEGSSALSDQSSTILVWGIGLVVGLGILRLLTGGFMRKKGIQVK